jgi:hypothetical protein
MKNASQSELKLPLNSGSAIKPKHRQYKAKGVLQLRIISSRHTRCRALQIHSLDGIPNLCTLIDEVAEVFSSNFAFASDLASFFALRTELFDRALKTDAEIVGREAEDFANGGRDAVAVCMDVVDGCELGGDFGGEAVRERMWDLVEDVGCCYDG